MYYVNREGIERRLDCIPELVAAQRELNESWTASTLQGLAQERILHLALEIVTDIGSSLIDGFMMRDASSYEDIVDVIAGEGVIPEARAQALRRLVTLRRPLVQDYDRWPRRELHPLSGELPELLTAFAKDIRAYLRRELDPWEKR
ncbi:MAG: DUF86 domain-containing protein [Cohnella sp.]|uniref:DUF86 domain-containing protein n=1 Tax=Cohnella sp. TaxID=1883426 RepID=UPI000E3749A0|nr:HepT-like ribonuclease domain-containing protein [Cohnella sp.]REK65380.1 MAG: DUF86 domain-containing protein [Cohnella sp.]